MKPVIVSFFTPAYADEAAEMEATARVHGMFTDVRAVPDLGEWVLNCAHKPAFIRDRMRDYPDRPIVWLDADARVRQQPVLFDTFDCDFACHYRHGEELLSGTLYFGATVAARGLVDTWCEAQRQSPSVWDQKVLQQVVDGMGRRLKVQHLPAEYVRVFDDPKMGEPVIWHGQASRRIRSSA